LIVTIIIMLVAILLVLVVLAQNSKGGGLSSSVGISNQVMGVQRSTENVEKITWILVGALGVCCVLSGLVFNTKAATTSTQNTGFEPLKTNYEVPVNPTNNLGTQGTTTFGGTNTNPAQ